MIELETFLDASKGYYSLITKEPSGPMIKATFDALNREGATGTEVREAFRVLATHPGEPRNLFGALFAIIKEMRRSDNEMRAIPKYRDVPITSPVQKLYMTCIVMVMQYARGNRRAVDDLLGEQSWLYGAWMQCCDSGGGEKELGQIVEQFKRSIFPVYTGAIKSIEQELEGVPDD